MRHIPATWVVSFIRRCQILQCFRFCKGFQDYQILFASVYAPFISVAHVDLDTEDKGTHVSLCWLVCFIAHGIVSPSSFQSHNVLHLSCRNLYRLSCYGIWNVCRATYIMHILGYRRAGPTLETACSLLAVAGEAYLMAWKPLRDWISQCTLV